MDGARRADEAARDVRHPATSPGRQDVRQLRELTRRGSMSFVFAGRGKAGYLAENTLKIALHRLGFPVTAHGLRSTITDLLGRQGFLRDAVERQLDHVERNKVRAAYSRMITPGAPQGDAAVVGRLGPGADVRYQRPRGSGQRCRLGKSRGLASKRRGPRTVRGQTQNRTARLIRNRKAVAAAPGS